MRKILEERLENAKLDYRYHLTGLGNDGFVDTNVYKIEGQIEAYQDCLNLLPPKRTEQEILKDFEALGYKAVVNNEYELELHKNNKKPDMLIVLNILKSAKEYQKYMVMNGKMFSREIKFQEHKLLNELYEVLQWI